MMKPSAKRSRYLRHTAILYCWVLRQLGLSAEQEVRSSYRLARHYVADEACTADFAPPLCRLMAMLPATQRRHLFNADHANGNRLLAWWAQQKKREGALDAAKKLAAGLRRHGLQQLSLTEQVALGLQHR